MVRRGRPITNHTREAQRKRESMRRSREAHKNPKQQFNPAPLVQVLNNWRTQ